MTLPMNNRIQIGIMGWSAYRISGTGSIVRTLLQGLQSNSQVQFLVALPETGKVSFSNFNLKTVKVAGERIDEWMVSAQKVLSPQTDAIFYPDSLALSKSTGQGIVTLLHDILPLSLPEYYLNPCKYFSEKMKFLKVARYADQIITISQYSRQMIINKLGIPKEKICLIYNGIDLCFYNPKLPDTPHRRGILYVGDLRRRKNAISLVKAYRLLDDSIKKEHPLILTANTKEEKEGKKIMKILSNSPPIFLPKLNLKKLKEAYTNAKVFVFPSLMEGFGLPVIEAQHCGLPVICGEHSGLKEITETPKDKGDPIPNVCRVNVSRPKEIAKAITDLITQPSLYRDLQQRGFSNSERFTAARMVKKYQDFFEEFSQTFRN